MKIIASPSNNRQNHLKSISSRLYRTVANIDLKSIFMVFLLIGGIGWLYTTGEQFWDNNELYYGPMPGNQYQYEIINSTNFCYLNYVNGLFCFNKGDELFRKNVDLMNQRPFKHLGLGIFIEG